MRPARSALGVHIQYYDNLEAFYINLFFVASLFISFFFAVDQRRKKRTKEKRKSKELTPIKE